jgi:membrane fusion protein, multidrug efflux system
MTLALATLVGCSKGDGRTAAKSGAKAGILVETVVLQPQHLDNNIITTGTLMANEEVELRAEISGRVTGVHFQEGKRVRKGDLLLKINDRELKAQLKRCEAQEKLASDDEGRKRKLLDSKSISQEEYDKAVDALHMAEADAEAIQAQISETEIKAPFDGIVGLRHVSEGGYVTPDVLAATMQDVDPMKVEFSVPEKYAAQIKSGTTVTVLVGESTEGCKGAVYAVESKIDPGTRTIKARATIPNPSGLLIPGSFSKVEIALEQLDSAIVVPSGAVIPDISGETVFLYRGGKAKSVPVKTGIRTETGVQITAGLAGNDTLIVTGLLQLADGKSVQVKGASSR